jgi:drug/metabolite transporter (DMT)-like permease
MKARDLAVLVGLGAIWGVSFVFITVALRAWSPILLAAVRFDLVAAVLFAAALVRRDRILPAGRSEWLAVTAAGLLSIAGYHAFLFWGQERTTEGISAIIVGLNPILSTVVAKALLPSERVSLRNLAGLGLGLAGIVVLALLKPGDPLDVKGIGELAVLAAIACWAVGSVTVKATGHRLPLTSLIAWQSLIGALAMHAASLALEPDARWSLDGPSLRALGYMALVASCVGLPMYYHLLHRVGPVRSNLVSYLAAVSTSIVAFLWLREPIETRAYVAFAMILAGFALTMSAPAGAPVPALPPEEPE